MATKAEDDSYGINTVYCRGDRLAPFVMQAES